MGSAVTDRGLHAQRSSVMIAKNNSETAFYTSMNDTGSDSYRQDPHTPPTAIHRRPYCVPGQHQLLHTRKIGAAGAATRRLRPPRPRHGARPSTGGAGAAGLGQAQISRGRDVDFFHLFLRYFSENERRFLRNFSFCHRAQFRNRFVAPCIHVQY